MTFAWEILGHVFVLILWNVWALLNKFISITDFIIVTLIHFDFRFRVWCHFYHIIKIVTHYIISCLYVFCSSTIFWSNRMQRYTSKTFFCFRCSSLMSRNNTETWGWRLIVLLSFDLLINFIILFSKIWGWKRIDLFSDWLIKKPTLSRERVGQY